MLKVTSAAAARSRILITRILGRFGFQDNSFLLVPAVLIGAITSFAAVGFHELTGKIEALLYSQIPFHLLYGRLLPLLIVFPAAGGLIVGLISRHIARSREGHGVTDVIESVIRTQGFVRPGLAIEKIFTSAITIGTGGSAGAEGPIVQIGAAIASGVGNLFRIARHEMPVLVGCGSAAGISAIFNAPIGGVLFTLEVILQDFSIRTFTPLVVASVIANVTTRSIFARLHGGVYLAIFHLPPTGAETIEDPVIRWRQIPVYLALGLICGIVGVALTRLMGTAERAFKRLDTLRVSKPAVGGGLVGVLGIFYVLVFGRLMLGQPKPFPFQQYPMPAFFADGYGVIQQLLDSSFYTHWKLGPLLTLLAILTVLKLVATCVTLASGGSGGVIAPSLFVGATSGAILGTMIQHLDWFRAVHPEVYALVGMGAALAAVVHAPLASILILFELTGDYRVTLPAMLAIVTAVGVARLLFPDSIYTHSLRDRGIRWNTAGSHGTLHRMSVEQVPLRPAATLKSTDSVQRIYDLILQNGVSSFVVTAADGTYEGSVVTEEINLALFQRDVMQEMLVHDFMRTDIPVTRSTDDLASVLDRFTQYGVSELPVGLSHKPTHVIGIITRAELMRVYQASLAA